MPRRRQPSPQVAHSTLPGGHPRRHLGLDLPALARRLLPARAAAARRAGLRRRADEQRGDQRQLLLAAAAVGVRDLGRGGARRLRVRGQGRPVHHPHARAGREELFAERRRRGAARPAARLAPAGAPRRRRRRARLGRALRLRRLPLPQRRAAARTRVGAVLLPPQAREPSRGTALERRLLLRPGSDRDPARHDQGDGTDRDDPRCLRDGRDPLRAPRALGRPERRSLGLHLLA